MISVYGATGFIGSHFCRMYPDMTVPVPRKRRIPCSNEILYLISTTHNYNNLSLDVRTNLQVLSEVLERLTENDTLNFVSSWFVCSHGISPVAEDDLFPTPTGNYSLTKYLAEQLVTTYCTTNNIPYRIFRLANVFGEGDKFSEQKNAFQYLVNEMKHNRDIGLYYGGEFYRDFIYVEDVCEILFGGMKVLPLNEIYHVGWGGPVMFLSMIRAAQVLLGSISKIYTKEPPEFHHKVQVKNFWFDTRKIESYNLFASNPFDHIKDIL